MTRRVIELLLLVALAAVWGWSRDSAPMAVGGTLVGALVWAVIDSLRANRVLKWLNKADVSRAPDMTGTWGEVLDRCRRLVKGYSDTNARGLSKFDRVTQATLSIAHRDDAADWCRRLREAALKDEEGKALDGAIRTIQSFA